MRRLGVAVALAVMVAPMGTAGAAPERPASQSKAAAPGATAASRKFRAPYERAWAAAVRASGKKGRCDKIIGRRNAEALTAMCSDLSGRWPPMCRPDYDCNRVSGNVWGLCADFWNDPKVNRQTPRDPNHVPCLDTYELFNGPARGR